MSKKHYSYVLILLQARMCSIVLFLHSMKEHWCTVLFWVLYACLKALQCCFASLNVKLQPGQSLQVDQSCPWVSAVVAAAVVMGCHLVQIGPHECLTQYQEVVSPTASLVSRIGRQCGDPSLTSQCNSLFSHKSLFSTLLTSHFFMTIVSIIFSYFSLVVQEL